tara:strand:- start:7653 stop:9698 length:2046 start_codon:yes stop_codon:yes gene_type:complete
MVLRGFLILTLLFVPSVAISAPGSAPDAAFGPTARVSESLDDDLEELEKAFRAACRRPDLEARKVALANLLELGDEKAIPGLVGEMAQAESKRREASQDIAKLTAEIERDEAMLKSLQLRAERDESLKKTVGSTESRLREKRGAMNLKQDNLRIYGGWVTALSTGLGDFMAALPAGKRQGIIRDFEKDAKKHEMVDVQLASIILLGYTADAKSAITLQGLMARAITDRDKAAKKLPKLEKEAIKYEERLQEEAEANAGRTSQATADQYNEAKRDATEQRRVLQNAAAYADLCQEAARRILERADGPALEGALKAFLKQLEKAKGGVRLRTLHMLAIANAEPIRVHLRILLSGTSEPAAIAQLLDDLAALGDQEIEGAVIQKYLVHESWHVRGRAAAALATLRSRAGVPAMIARLELAEGREKTDLHGALVSLTGKDFRTNFTLWQRWWDAEGEAFVVVTEEQLAEIEAAEADTEGVTFFGIRTDSQKVIFILDVSGSMNWSTVVRSNPYDDPNQQPDLPRGNERSRIDVAKGDLKKAIGGLRDGAVFNIVVYATEVRRWKDDMQIMTPEIRSEVLDYVGELKAVGGTNIFGSLKEAFSMAGVDTEASAQEWANPIADTIFLLTDGTATVGVVTNSDGILSHVKEWNLAAGIVLHTIGLSGAQDAYLLSTLAKQNHGEYVAH